MKIVHFAAPAAALLLIVSGRASAQATQDVSFEVQAISELTFTGSPSLVISAATAGSAPTSATASASYAISTNELNRTITAEIDSDMPTGLTLSVSLAAPSGATSSGVVALSTTAQPVVTGVANVNASGLGVSYSLAATSAAGVVAADTRTVTYTIIAGA
jgi:hypothetical protein